jgi:tetratricopeptide (TPR) repeat protein
MKAIFSALFVLCLTMFGYSQTSTNFLTQGIQKARDNDLQGSISDFTKAIEINTNNWEAYYNRGLSKAKLQNYSGAVNDYSTAIKLNPSFADAYYNRGNVKAQKFNEFKEAIADYDKAIIINPNDGEAYGNRGLSKIKLGQKEGGCIDLYKANELGYSKATQLILKYCN